MPWMLQPKNYVQIARPNLYNVAYRRVASYKGMGRVNPTNYLLMTPRPRLIGHTTGQYNTLSRQLSLTPPGFRGLGQADGPSDIPAPVQTTNLPLIYNYGYSTPQQELALAQALGPATGTTIPTKPVSASFLSQYGGYLAIGAGVLMMIAAVRRR